ncbi:pilus assembly protein CpaF [Symbiobacterium terraclitae]|uniref:Pilus assembly protein CpaF n=1 Tax=Symbiobacterium terraclitae TaxID=557451 RepID=A0ABS4JUG7_9FIRM|nr:pilus assembly protein CpaF [Symbiobacterium terraclitae]
MNGGLRQLIERRQGRSGAAGPPRTHERLRPVLEAVRERLRSTDAPLAALSDREMRDRLWALLEEVLADRFGYLHLTHHEKAALVDRLQYQIFGFGLLDPLLQDDTVKEIMVNGPGRIFVERSGHPEPALTEDGQPLAFGSEAELLHLIERIVARVNRKVDEATPIVDARLPGGARVHVVLPPVSLVGPVLTIRKFPQHPLSLEQMVEAGTLTPLAAEFLERLVQARCNLVISGGTSTGKTTFLNALAMKIPAHERVITIEDSAELQLTGIPNLVSLEARPPNVEGKGALTIRDLVRASLRMRPDRIVVGECRGGEALDMLQAMNTGHDGSLTTVHANSARDALARIETMVLMSGVDLPAAAVRQQVASAVDFILHLERLTDGSRRLWQILEVTGAAGGEVATEPVFQYDLECGALLPAGRPVGRREKFRMAGVTLPEGL